MKASRDKIPTVITAITARTHLGQVMDRAQLNKERFLIEHYGQPRAIILSVEDFIELAGLSPSWLDRCIAVSQKKKDALTATSF